MNLLSRLLFLVPKLKDYQRMVVQVELNPRNSFNFNKIIQDFNLKFNLKIMKLICLILKLLTQNLSKILSNKQNRSIDPTIQQITSIGPKKLTINSATIQKNLIISRLCSKNSYIRKLDRPIKQIETISSRIGQNNKTSIFRQYKFLIETKRIIYKIGVDGSIDLDTQISYITKIDDSLRDEKEYIITGKKDLIKFDLMILGYNL